MVQIIEAVGTTRKMKPLPQLAMKDENKHFKIKAVCYETGTSVQIIDVRKNVCISMEMDTFDSFAWRFSEFLQKAKVMQDNCSLKRSANEDAEKVPPFKRPFKTTLVRTGEGRWAPSTLTPVMTTPMRSISPKLVATPQLTNPMSSSSTSQLRTLLSNPIQVMASGYFPISPAKQGERENIFDLLDAELFNDEWQ